MVQSPGHDWRQPHEIAEAPQALLTHMAPRVPPATTTQICPDAQVNDDRLVHRTVPHAPVLIVQRGWASVLKAQLATVRPAPAQSS